ncbi:MAG: alpha/beta hydrolase [Mycolicibacter algericus]|uniref:alpha/beta fold hydrolase n=1 Tax=Mycolicibacter algericus TaxID=1288388 RepID=UPI003C72E8CF
MITESRACHGGVGTRVLAVAGGGTPVILLHGYGDSADTWRPVLAGLAAAGRRGCAVDLPGFGQADKRTAGPMVPQFDAFVDALLTDTGPAVLVGNSLGAATAVRAASRSCHVRSLVALNDPLNARHWLAQLARRRALPSRLWSGLGRAPIPSPMLRRATRLVMPKLLYGPGVEPDPLVIAYWCGTAAPISAVANLGRYAFQYALETAGGHRDLQVECPAVIVHGARDRIIPVQASRVLHRQIPGSELVVLPRSGHCPQLDNPAEVARIILRLSDVQGAGQP